MTNSPTLSEFITSTRKQFRFLEDEFGFHEISNDLSENEFLIKYEKHPVQVRVEGINWGVGVQVMLIDLSQDKFEDSRVPLWALARFKEKTYDEDVSGQLERLVVSSNFLRSNAKNVLNGDFSEFPKIYKLMMEIANRTEAPRRILP